MNNKIQVYIIVEAWAFLWARFMPYGLIKLKQKQNEKIINSYGGISRSNGTSPDTQSGD